MNILKLKNKNLPQLHDIKKIYDTFQPRQNNPIIWHLGWVCNYRTLNRQWLLKSSNDVFEEHINFYFRNQLSII